MSRPSRSKPRFRFLTGDVNYLQYGGTWYSQKFNNGEFDYWFVLRLINWEDSVGEREAKEVGYKYNICLSVVAPEQYKNKDAAILSSGQNADWDELSDAMKVETVHSYSGGAPILDLNGDNYKKLFKAARQKAYESTMLFGFAMDVPKNRLGSTGWDFLRGDCGAGLKRYEEAGKQGSDPMMDLMSKIQKAGRE